MSPFFETLRQRLLDALYPRNAVCHLCSRERVTGPDGVCAECESRLKTARPVAPQPLDGLSVPFLYESPVREAIHRLKYGNATYLADFFAARASLPGDWDFSLIVPVPLYPARERKRGYNQSEMLARALKETAHVPGEVRTDLLRRVRNTPSQTRLSREERAKNLKNAFSVTGDAAGLGILLVDDVTTTGATLSVCARVLKEAGAARVYAFCAADTQLISSGPSGREA